MSQRQLADADIKELLTLGPFLGIDNTTSPYFLDPYHAEDSIAMVPNRAFNGYCTARGRVRSLASPYASALTGLTKFQRVGLPDNYIAAVTSGGHGALQSATLGGSPAALTLPVSLTAGQETSFCPYQQWLFTCNPLDIPLKIDANLNVSQWQIAPPPLAPVVGVFAGPDPATLTLTNVAGSSNASQVYVQVTYIDANGDESALLNTNFATQTPSAAQQVSVHSPTSPPTWVKKYNVYATNNIAGSFYLQNATPITLGTNYTIPGTPTTGTATSPVWTGNLVGTYYYLVTYANGFQESSASPPSLGTTFTNVFAVAEVSGPALITLPISSDPQVTGRNIYRFGGTNSEIQLVGTVNDNTTTGFVDNTPDASVVGQTLVQHRDPPQPFFSITAHKGRMWGFGYAGTAVGEASSIQGTSDLWFSNYEEPWAFNNVSQIMTIGRNSGGDVAVKLASTGSILCCLKSKSFWAVYGDTPQDFIAMQLAPIGCGSKKSVVSAYGRLFWLSNEGAVYMFDGSNFTNISDNRTTQANSSIKAALDSFSTTDFAQATGAASDQMYLLSFPTQNITFMYDIPTGQWYKLPWAFDRAAFDIENQNEVHASEIGSGQLDAWFAAETDLGSPITSAYTSRISDSAAPQATKRYRYLQIVAPVQNAEATVSITADSTSPNAQTNTLLIDLSTGTPSKRFSQPPNMIGGDVQIVLSVTSSARADIYRVSLYGWIERQFSATGSIG